MYDLEFIMYILLLSPTPFLYAHTHEYIVPAAARLGSLCWPEGAMATQEVSRQLPTLLGLNFIIMHIVYFIYLQCIELE